MINTYTKFFVIFFGLLACNLTSKIKDGNTAFQYKQYNKAIELLSVEYESAERKDIKAQKAFSIAESYLKLSNIKLANQWYLTAINLGYGLRATYGAALTFKQMEQYNQAIEYFQKLKGTSSATMNVDRMIFNCKNAMVWKEEAIDNYSLRKLLPSDANSNYSPVLYQDDLLVFTSDREESTGSKDYQWTGRKMSDLFIINKNGGSPKRFDAFINSTFNEGTAVFNAEYNEMYFTRCYNSENIGDQYCKLMYAKKFNEVWEEPKLLPFISNNVNYGQPCLIEGDSVLVFSSISEDGTNGYDLWYSVKEGESWSQPFPMPSSINTPGNEYFPTSDGDTLFFSSDYLPGMGGLDIYKTYLENGSWSEPVNMKPPYNSGADDFGLIRDRSGRKSRSIEFKGYFTSSRDMQGHDDIYYYEIYKANPSKEVVEEAEKDTISNIDLYIAGKVLEYIYEDESDPNSMVTGKKPINDPFVQIIDEDGAMLDISANNKGLFIGSVEMNKSYLITAKKQGYLNNQIQLSTIDLQIDKGQTSKTINVEVFLEKIYKGKEVVLDNIYYDFDAYFIREDAQPTLDILAEKLLLNPQVRIELSSHTDCRGEEDYNLDLSQKRAQATADYLISKGVRSDRIIPKGYGESSPIDSCMCENCSEEQHQLNRRTAFKIL
jgi:outer membrane protein OmpA-like peptidoglycan-associated protein